ncbi:MAG: hypothetical protein HYV34_02725 [Candidatus Kerfeldbacteria bacterium]|nr:hypothetical protein [Candidatus Kerfeldbacteria bacterium]
MRSERGYTSLILTVALGSLFLVVLSSLLLITLSDVRIVTNSVNGLRAFHAAEAGAERIISDWNIDPVPTAGRAFENEPLTDAQETSVGTYTIDVFDLGGGKWRIESEGTSKNAIRKIQTDVNVGLGGPSSAFSKALATNSNISLPSNMHIWGDIYVHEGFIETWNSGGVYATDGNGAQYDDEPTLLQAPFGRLEYYYTGDDEWIVNPRQTLNGDAFGYWESAQKIQRTTTWLNPLHNIGNPDVESSGQYYNRDNRGNETLFPSAAELYRLKTGIAVRNSDHPLEFPDIDNGTYANFVAYYDSIMPDSTKWQNLKIKEPSGATISLANGRNSAIIGATPNGNGFPTQFTWTGSAVRDDGSVYEGPLEFADTFALYVDGPASFDGPVGMSVFTVISSSTTTIGQLTEIPSNFSVMSFDDIMVNINIDITGAFFTSGTYTASTPANVRGVIVARAVDFRGGGFELVYDQNVVLDVRQWLPGGSNGKIDIIRWSEILP